MIKRTKIMPLAILTILLIVSIVSTGCSSLGSQSDKKADTRVVKDMLGNELTIPYEVKKTGTSWPGFCNAIFTVGGADKLTITPKALNSYPWSYKLYPDMKNRLHSFNGKDMNVEEILNNKPDALFLRKTDKIDKIKEVGIPIAMVEYRNNSISDVTEGVTLAGNVLGEKEALKGKEYKDYVDKTINKIKETSKSIKQENKKKVLYLSCRGKKLSVWGSNMPQTEAIELAGGINVASDSIGGFKEVSPEQILVWNPDIIVVEGNKEERSIFNNKMFKELDAVKNSKVYTSPIGVFSWARLGAESILQTQWIAKAMYPEVYKDIDIKKESTDFYKKFFGYNLTDKEINLIISGDNL